MEDVIGGSHDSTYSMVMTVLPIRARRRLKRGRLAIEGPGAQLIGAVPHQIAQEMDKDFPPIRSQAVRFKHTEKADPLIDNIKIPFSVRALATLESLDYMSPVPRSLQMGHSLVRRIILG